MSDGPKPIQHMIAGVAGATVAIGLVLGWLLTSLPLGLPYVLNYQNVPMASSLTIIALIQCMIVGSRHVLFTWLVPALLRGEELAYLRDSRLPTLWTAGLISGACGGLPILVRAWTYLK